MSLIERSHPREIKFTTRVNPHHPSSVIAEFGQTKVYITAIIEESVPGWMRDSNSGWVTAEYSMLPGSSDTRIRRERKSVGGRTQEIQRLIGRSLRAIIDLDKLGAFVALKLAINELMKKGLLKEDPIRDQLGAISIGVNKAGKVIADLNYEEDSSCETDMNIVMTRAGEFVEIQGTAEGKPFNSDQLTGMLECAKTSLEVVFSKQNEVLK